MNRLNGAGPSTDPAIPDAPATMRLRVSMRQVSLVAGGLAICGLLAVRLVHTWTWGAPAAGGSAAFVGLVLAGLMAHELLHALAFVAGGARWSDVHIGGSLRYGLAYAGCRAEIGAGAYRFVLLAPGVVLGVLPLVVGLATGHYRVAQLGAVLLAAAGGDLCFLWAMRAVPAEARIGEDATDVFAMVVRMPPHSTR
jgi:hypothetical protein